MSGGRVVVHATRLCLWCRRATRLLEQRGVPYELVDVSGDRAARAALAARCGRTSVPQIWIGERWIGGYRELEALDDRGELAALAAG